MVNSATSPVLAIAIPTFNRGGILEENIQIILKQISGFSVIIYISDNCSSDETQFICERLQNQNNCITYSRNEKNIGFDGNIVKLLNWVRGDYIWFLGDDDFLVDSAIANLFRLFSEENADAYILNGANRGEILRLKNQRPTTIYTEINNFLSDMWCHQTWMSSIVVRRELVSGFDGAIFKDSLFMHVQALNYALTRHDEFKLVYDSRIFATYPNEEDIVNSYTPKALWLFVDRWDHNIYMLPLAVNFETRLKCKRSTNFRGRTLFTLRGQGNYNKADYIKYKSLLKDYGFIQAGWLAAHLPIFFCRWLSFGVKKLRTLFK